QAVVARVDAQTLEHADEAFAREDRLVERIARAVEADDEPIADEHVVAHALEIGDVLDARGGAGRLGGGDERAQGERGESEAAKTSHASNGDIVIPALPMPNPCQG